MRKSILGYIGIGLIGLSAASADDTTPVDFSADILPILSDRCFQCHGPDAAARKAGLRLDLEDAAKADAIVAGQPAESELLRRIITADPDDRMPPEESEKPALTVEEAALFEAWIAQGAPWSNHWAYEAPVRPDVAPMEDTAWGHNPIDQFVLSRITAKNLSPATEAPRATLLRRVTLDLTGLPPTLEEIDAFVADESPDAYEKVVDRLLASPRYGVHLASEWLDGARFADSNGYQNDFARDMSGWREWVINAYNDNMPFDQFTVEQIAGDLLPNATDSQRIATGFNRNNASVTEGGAIEAEWRVENMVDRIETTSSVFLGLTMGCARCHDHKYDPISQREFYEFFAIFHSTADAGYYNETRGNTGPQVPVPTDAQREKMAAFDARIPPIEAAIEEAAADDNDEGLAAWLASFESVDPDAAPESAVHLPLAGDLNFNNEARPLPAIYGAEGDPSWQEGLLGDAIELDGTPTSQVSLGKLVKFDRKEPFTVALWVRADGPGALFSQMDDEDSYRGVDTLITENGELSVHIIRRWEGNALKITTDQRIEFGKWSQVAVTYDGSSKAEGIRVFVNGHEATKRIDVDHLTLGTANSEPFRLGSRSTGAHLKGAITDFRFFDTALEPDAIAGLTRTAIARVAQTDLTDARRAALNDFYRLQEAQEVLALHGQIAAIKAEKAAYISENVRTVMVMEELPEPRPTYLLVRGAYDAPDTSEVLEPGLPAFLPPWPEGAPHNRLGLAKWLVDPANPLTARVIVNRMWQRFFGRGLVKTPENFGVQSEPPTHPALLDWLATEFIRIGWDQKALQKLIVMSATYRQDSTISPEDLEADPENILLARGPRFRMPAEMLRDNALAVSGLLVEKFGGPSVYPYQPEGLWEELAGGASMGPYEAGEGDDLYRRSVYNIRKRTVPPPMLTTFDAPSREVCRVYRGRTNTPLQALAVLNDVTYVEAARHLATRMLTETGPDAAQRVRYGFRLATGREPSAREAELLLSGFANYLDNYRQEHDAAEALVSHGASPVPADADRVALAAYTTLASVILNLDETMTKE